jgi:hypothetical protein
MLLSQRGHHNAIFLFDNILFCETPMHEGSCTINFPILRRRSCSINYPQTNPCTRERRRRVSGQAALKE